MESKMKSKTIIYEMVDGLGSVGGGLPPQNSPAISPDLQQQRDRVKDVADFHGMAESQEPKPLTDRVKKGIPSQK